jgi:hypothetical protein
MWFTDVESCCVLTDQPEAKHAAAIGLRLGGTAKEMFRQIPARTLRDGVTDLVTGLHETGLELLMRELRQRYGKLGLETSMHALVQMLKFQRRNGERFDEANSRFENIRIRCSQVSPEFTLPWPLKALLYLDSMGTPRHMWPLVLAPWGGRHPQGEEGFRLLQDNLRQQGHINEMGQQHPSIPHTMWRASTHRSPSWRKAAPTTTTRTPTHR